MYEDGGHLGHVTKTISINVCAQLHIKFGFDWPCVPEKIIVTYMYIAAWQEHAIPWGQKFPFNYVVTVLSHSKAQATKFDLAIK